MRCPTNPLKNIPAYAWQSCHSCPPVVTYRLVFLLLCVLTVLFAACSSSSLLSGFHQICRGFHVCVRIPLPDKEALPSNLFRGSVCLIFSFFLLIRLLQHFRAVWAAFSTLAAHHVSSAGCCGERPIVCRRKSAGYLTALPVRGFTVRGGPCGGWFDYASKWRMKWLESS